MGHLTLTTHRGPKSLLGHPHTLKSIGVSSDVHFVVTIYPSKAVRTVMVQSGQDLSKVGRGGDVGRQHLISLDDRVEFLAICGRFMETLLRCLLWGLTRAVTAKGKAVRIKE
ncbi:hypothetical protein ACLOJK_008095 [Asimina triloba]